MKRSISLCAAALTLAAGGAIAIADTVVAERWDSVNGVWVALNGPTNLPWDSSVAKTLTVSPTDVTVNPLTGVRELEIRIREQDNQGAWHCFEAVPLIRPLL